MKQVALIICFIPALAYGRKADPCRTWANDCRNVQALRHARQAEFESRKPVLTCHSLSPKPFQTVEALSAQMPKSSPYNQEEFMHCLSQNVQEIKRMQAEDLKVIARALEHEGVTGIALKDIETVLNDPASRYVQIKQQLKAQKHRTVFEENALAGPLTRFENSLRGSVAKPGLPLIRLFNKSALDELGELTDPAQILERLQSVARKGAEPNHGGIPISPSRDRIALTPAVAKFVMVEILRLKMQSKPQEFAAILNQLHLKSDFKSPRSREVSEPSSVTVHYGYTLAAPLPSLEEVESPTGFDCTSVIQVCQQKAGMKFPPNFRLNSKRLAAIGDKLREKAFSEIGFYKQTYASEAYQCEAQLQPGDIVAFNGHAFVFAGYSPAAEGKLEIQTIEAMGGEIRSFDSFHRDLYAKDACEPAHFSPLGDTRARIIRVAL